MAKKTSRERRADEEEAVALAAQQSERAEGQPLADGEQTPSDADQRRCEGDRDRGDGDQLAADRDQAGVGRGAGHGGDLGPGAFGRDVRQRAARHREHAARARLDAGAVRDAIAQARDLAALTRDGVAAARDLAMAERAATDQREAGARAVSGAEIVMRAAAQRRSAGERRARAAEHLVAVGLDREAAARDREHAARERRLALADREALAHHVASVETDALTGARTRAAGLLDLEHERDRCRRTSALLVIAYVHVDSSSSVGEHEGRAAGEEAIKRVVERIHDDLRSYDLIVRLDRDDVLCAMSNMPVRTARQRFGAIATAGNEAVTTGFAQLTLQESTTELIARAHGTRR